MPTDRNKSRVDSIKRLLRRGALSHIRKIVNKTHAADLSVVFRSLSFENHATLFNMISDMDKKASLFSELEKDALISLSDKLPVEEVAGILERMPGDDAADIIGDLPEELSAIVLKKMKKEGSEEVSGLLRYSEDTAGGIMTPEFIALDENTTAGEAVKSLQTKHQAVEMAFYLYVVDDYGKLVGVCSLRQLVVVPPETPLKDFMSTGVISVQTDMDQEEVARIVARYDILAVPVVDDDRRLVGIVTVDDVIDIFREEATEDFLKMAGAGEEFVETKSVFRSTRIRLPWLFASCIGGLIAFVVIDHFEDSLAKLAYLAAFIPIITGMGGNIGIQSSTIVVRGLATGRIQTREFWAILGKELCVGLLLGMVYGTLIALVAQFQYSLFDLAFSIGLSVVCSMSLAALVGSLVPLFFARINIDPAVATGPFVTTTIDIISVFFYLQIATTLLIS